MRRATPSLLITLVLGGCVGPRPLAPSASAITDVPSGWRADPQAALTGDVSSRWWQALGDPGLDRLVERALAFNTDVGMAAARVNEARAVARDARAARSPDIVAESHGGYSRSVTLGIPVDAIGGSSDIAASWDLDLFGRLAKADASARAALLSSRASRDAVSLAVASTVAKSYVRLLAADQRLTLLRLTLASRADALAVARRLAEAGYSSKLELKDAESEYAATAQLLPQVELEIFRLEDAISRLSGDSPHAIPRIVSGLESLRMPAIPAGLPSALLRRRPDVVSAEDTLVAADRSLDSERAAMLPDLALTGSGGAVYANTLPSPLSIFNVAGSILAPIFDAGRRRAQADAAAARRDAAAFAYRATFLAALGDVEDRLAGVARLNDRARLIASQVDANEARLRIIAKRRETGYASSLEQLDAQRQLLAAQLSLVDADADRLENYIGLNQALGGGWSDGHQS